MVSIFYELHFSYKFEVLHFSSNAAWIYFFLRRVELLDLVCCAASNFICELSAFGNPIVGMLEVRERKTYWCADMSKAGLGVGISFFICGLESSF